jgi:hypothetical protein
MSVRCFSQANMAAARRNPNFSGQRWERQCGAGLMSFAELSRRLESLRSTLRRQLLQHSQIAHAAGPLSWHSDTRLKATMLVSVQQPGRRKILESVIFLSLGG